MKHLLIPLSFMLLLLVRQGFSQTTAQDKAVATSRNAWYISNGTKISLNPKPAF
jgi:hypothetical protein